MESLYESVCLKYAQKVGNEVGWLEEIILAGMKSIKPAGPSMEPLLKDMHYQAYYAALNMQIVYLVNIFDFFVQDYIKTKDCLSEEDLQIRGFWLDYLSPIIRSWDSYCQSTTDAVNTSRSFMNLSFSFYVLERKYGVCCQSDKKHLLSELGSLRNCLVHHSGELCHKDKGGNTFRYTLARTLEHLEIGDEIERITDLRKNKYVSKVTFGLQDFIYSCA